MIDVEDVLNSYSSTNALSANMGRVLNGYIDDLSDRVTALEGGTTGGSCSCSLVIW